MKFPLSGAKSKGRWQAHVVSKPHNNGCKAFSNKCADYAGSSNLHISRARPAHGTRDGDCAAGEVLFGSSVPSGPMPIERGFAARMPRERRTPGDRAYSDPRPLYRMPLDSGMQRDYMTIDSMPQNRTYVSQHPVAGPPGYVRQGNYYVPVSYEGEVYGHQNPEIQFNEREPRDPNYHSRFTLKGRDARYANQRPASREIDQSTLGVRPYHQREATRQSKRNPGPAWQNEPNASALGSDDLSVTLPSEHKEWQEMQFARDLISRMGPRARRAIPSSKDIILGLLDCFAFMIRWRASSTNEKIAASLVRFGRR